MKIAGLIAAAMMLQAAGAATDGPPVAQPKYMRYLRALNVPQGAGQGTAQACAVLDAEIFPHAAPSLLDMRIFPAAAAGSPAPHEIPYAVTLSEPVTTETEQAKVLNLGEGAGHSITFDLEMPRRAYSAVTLTLDPALRDFLGTATVTAMDALGGKGHSVLFGSFTIFDLSAQHLSRSTELPLPESTFPYLHVVLTMAFAPGAQRAAARFVPSMVEGAEVPPSREEQTVYTTIAETSAVAMQGRESVAKFAVPARVPVERVEFVLAPTHKGNFSRDVRVTATAEGAKKDATGTPASSDEGSGMEGMEADQRAPLPETVTGAILRVHGTQAGREINTEELTVPAVIGANLQRGAKVEVAIENGDDQPLPIAAVRLEMRWRRLCFDAGAGPLALYYGDAALAAPVYDYERLFTPSEKPLMVTLGPQLANPEFTLRPGPPRSFLDRHPEALWVALIAAIAALGFVAVRSGKSVGR